MIPDRRPTLGRIGEIRCDRLKVLGLEPFLDASRDAVHYFCGVMSDSQRLLLQIQSMLGAAVMAVGSQGCDAAPQAEQVRAQQGAGKTQLSHRSGSGSTVKDKGGQAKAKELHPGSQLQAQGARSAKAASKGSTVKNDLPPPPIPGYRLGDPPFVEGWNPEEATCVSGNWCGPAAAAAKVVRIGTEGDLDPATKCPLHLMGKRKDGVDKKKRVYRGLSADRMMRGTFQPWRTQKTREQGSKQELCCYHWFDYCAGRPLDQGERTEQGRREIALSRAAAACDEAAHALALAYWADADDEYDSVAAFACCSLDLFALGAPAELIEASQRASLDELKHARQCQALSKHYHNHDWQARAPLQVERKPAQLAAFLLETFRHGCVGEAVASLRVSRMAAKSQDPMVKSTLAQIAQDEAQHAALAWKILDWGLQVGGEQVQLMLLKETQRLEQELLSEWDARPDPAPVYAERLSPQELRDCARDTWNGVVKPMLREHLAQGHSA